MKPLPRIERAKLGRIAQAFDDPGSVFELKQDGFRALPYISTRKCELISRLHVTLISRETTTQAQASDAVRQ